MPASVSVIDPLEDPRWSSFLRSHPSASVFHSIGWLEALKCTYGFQPVALTTSANGLLKNVLLLCRVETGISRRLVSLPFSDHCDPLVECPEALNPMLAFLHQEIGARRWRSCELRPRHVAPDGFFAVAKYWLHTLDLTPPEDRIFRGFHPSNTQRAIRRAEREGLSYETGTSDRLVLSFYCLLRQTRRRHGLPPQPLCWFRNLVACLQDTLRIHVASKNGIPVAAILTLSANRTLVYKYGGSDARHHRRGGMPFLFWRVIQEAKAQGQEELDLGRSDLDQAGLIAFKEHLGAKRAALTYYRHPNRRGPSPLAGRFLSVARKVVPFLPDAVLDLSGRLLYRHLG
jgi:hypothetical protein